MAGERILLVEDAPELRHFLADTVLRSAEYDVLTARDGTEGLALARDLSPDLIIADYQMPGMDGLAMLEALHAEGLAFPYILMTAEGSEQLAVRALRLGVNDYLIKPFDPDDLLVAVRRTLSEHWTRQITEHIPAQLLDANRQLEARLRELDTLVAIGKRVTGLLDLRQVLNRIVEAAVSLSQAEEGSLLLVDRQSGELYLYASTGTQDRPEKPFRLPVADSLAGQVIQTQQPLVITGEELHQIKTNYLFRALVYVPLRVKDHAIGVLGVSNRTVIQQFEPHTLQLLTVLADFSAIAIENARLYSAMQQERDTLNTILRDTEDAIIVTDPQNNILLCNPAACRIFKVDPAAIRGCALAEAIPHSEVVELFDQESPTDRSRRSEITLDGQLVMHAQLTIVKGVGRVVVMQDITHLKELDRIKSDFVTAVSHDLRSPLTAILGYVELVRRTGPLTDAQTNFVERIIFSVQSITALITDLLELGKIEAGFDESLSPTFLQDVVRHAIEAQRHQLETKQHVLEVTLPEVSLPVLGNPLRLRQLAANLLENAIKYTPPSGHIRITLEADGDFLVLRVTDTGIGIEQKDLPFIFDKFYRSDEAIDHYSGTGLGLSIVKGIVERHGGRIWVESQPGKGSTFTVMLPGFDPGQAG